MQIKILSLGIKFVFYFSSHFSVLIKGDSEIILYKN
jgi:hypothetical protein